MVALAIYLCVNRCVKLILFVCFLFIFKIQHHLKVEQGYALKNILLAKNSLQSNVRQLNIDVSKSKMQKRRHYYICIMNNYCSITCLFYTINFISGSVFKNLCLTRLLTNLKMNLSTASVHVLLRIYQTETHYKYVFFINIKIAS